MKKMNNKGFSLVELIIVIAIMAILVGVLAPQFIKYVEQSRQSTDIDTIDELKTAVETATTDNAITSGSTTITCNGGTATIAGGAVTSTMLDEYGVALSTDLKSTRLSITWTYDHSTFKWSVTDTSSGSAGVYYDAYGEKI